MSLMSSRMRKNLSIFSVALLSLTFFSGISGALSPLPGSQQDSAKAPATSENSVENSTAQRELTHAANEAAGREPEPDQQEALRHSASIKAIARITGLSIEKAYWLGIIINFVILFAILWVALRKMLPGLFKSRTEAIQKRLEESRKTTEEARRRLAEVEGRLSRLDTEIAQMRNEAEASAQAEEQRVLAAVEEERHRIVLSTEQEITMAASAARRELKAFAAELAVNLAEKKIQIGQSADQALVREFATQLRKDGR
ncbi:MAG TPA: ATP synthase F0 subunit B [Candidatus Solibacter sp.]|jgi:F-type H+-transporting ATPase subunit b|nr:ATP synthase F0 subunit B [Candidatus Solibacter sp.]